MTIHEMIYNEVRDHSQKVSALVHEFDEARVTKVDLMNQLYHLANGFGNRMFDLGFRIGTCVEPAEEGEGGTTMGMIELEPDMDDDDEDYDDGDA